MNAVRAIDPELGPVRWCRRCDEAWPFDEEFWYLEPGRPNAVHCRACKAEDARRFAVRARSTWDNSHVGISDTTSTDIMCDALSVADTSREGVARLEVSAP